MEAEITKDSDTGWIEKGRDVLQFIRTAIILRSDQRHHTKVSFNVIRTKKSEKPWKLYIKAMDLGLSTNNPRYRYRVMKVHEYNLWVSGWFDTEKEAKDKAEDILAAEQRS